jgi:sterol desaturase/sphingolipid hydroxylase (fatty acid hydroxylase superfamily)
MHLYFYLILDTSTSKVRTSKVATLEVRTLEVEREEKNMETYGKILLIAMPVFLVLVLLEKLYGWFKGYDTVRNMDMISSLTSGVTNVTKDVLGLSITVLSYEWLVRNIAVYHIEATWLTYLVAFLVLDFSSYWTHRWAHHINIFWNRHIVHHSSEEFNLACALRQSISVFINIFTFLLIPAALLGVPGKVIAVVAPLHLFAQFWYHTRHIGKMGFLEKIIVTPSHHRVHHAINPEYLDKNLAAIFIWWDKWFGTFQEELPDKPPVYGITRPVHTWNPIRINFQHLWLLIKDAWRTESLKDKLRIWFMPTGWRPADVVEKYPVEKIEDIYHFEKYNPRASVALHAWCWVQLVALLLIISYLFGNIAAIGNPGMFIYGGFIFIFVYALSELMDRRAGAIIWEIIKCLFGIYVITTTGDWFGISNLFPLALPMLGVYFLLSFAMTAFFVYKHYREDHPRNVVALEA